jgi:tetratricopeptide (TPR) repeat protein
MQSRLGRRSLDMYRDLTTMTLEQAAERFRNELDFVDRIDFSFCLPRATDVSGSRLELLYVKGTRASFAEDYPTARECFAALAQEDSFQAGAWAQLAVAEAMLGEHAAAAEHVKEALRLEPDDTSTSKPRSS